MFTKEDVVNVLDELKKSYPCFVSEAHFQMMFAIEAKNQKKDKFKFYPEYPIGKDHIDLMIVDCSNKEKTLIEFKYKTKNTTSGEKLSFILPPGVEVIPSSMGARPIAKYDCWKDIERLERFVGEKECSNGFFIFLTNDSLYWKEKRESEAYGNDFSMEEGNHECETKKWKDRDDIENIVGKGRMKHIENRAYKDENSFKYLNYSMLKKSFGEKELGYGEFKVLIVDVEN